MTTMFYIQGSCRILPGHEAAVGQLRARLEIDKRQDSLDLRGNVLELSIDAEVTGGWVDTAESIIGDFVSEHGDGGAVFSRSACGRMYWVFGATAEQRHEAEHNYLEEQLRFWSGRVERLALLRRLTPLRGAKLPTDFFTAVRLLKRPYVAISAADYHAILDLTSKHDTDVMLLDGEAQVTFGPADGGYALMPLIDPYVRDLPSA